ncbi:MAG: DUF2442 domain-containing protein [Bdellovibrionales bacterium]|nr:DUF2442 domain-containing protein [Bdellovibrionales bacterium]
MKSLKRGKSTSGAEIQNVSEFGIWMLISGREYFLTFKEFPWFQKASVKQIYNFEFLHRRHLYWPDLDIDLSLESLAAPEKFPLKTRS